MKIEITHVTVARAAKVGSLMGFFIFLVAGLLAAGNIFLSASMLQNSFWSSAVPGAFLIPVMVLSGIAYGAIFGAGLALCYNFVASRWGGIEFTSREVGAVVKRSSDSAAPAVSRANT